MAILQQHFYDMLNFDCALICNAVLHVISF